MKRLLAVFAALFALAAPGRLAAQQIRVGPGGQLTSLVGVPIQVPFVVDMSGRTEKLGAYALRVQWDPAVLRLEQGQSGNFGDPQVNEDSLAFGIVKLAGVNPAGVGGVVTLASVILTPLGNDTATIHVTPTELYAAGTFADLMPYAEVSDGLYCPARGYFGDVDGDGNANSRDALIALSNAVGLDVSAFDVSLGDVDANGATNARDALIILSSAVGMDVGAFRVMRIAGGSCAANPTLTMSVTPTGQELVSGQEVWFEARAADSTGALQTLADVTWRTSNPAVLGIFGDGRATARDTGTAVVTALRGTRDSARATVRVVARRTTHWVDALAANARNRLGTQDLPFGSIEEGLRLAQDGDTVRVRPGRYEPESEFGMVYLSRPVVLMGDTAADGSRPLIAGPGVGAETAALALQGTGSIEVHNFAVENFAAGVWVANSGRALVRGVVARGVMLGVYAQSSLQNLSIERSRFLGLPMGGPSVAGMRSPALADSGGPGPMSAGVMVYGIVDTLSIEESEISTFIHGVFLSPYVDSFALRRSSLHDFDGSAVTVSGGGYVCVECVAPAGSPGARPAFPSALRRSPGQPGRADMLPPENQALVFEGNRMVRAYGNLVSIGSQIRSASFSHNVITSPSGYKVVQVVPYVTGGYVSFRGDSIVAPPDDQHYEWLSVQDLDSLIVDSLVAVGFQTGRALYVPLVRVMNSTLRDARGIALAACFDYYCGMATAPPRVSGPARGAMNGGMPGGVLHLRNVSVYGDPRDDATATGIYANGMRVEADSLTAVNLYYGLVADGDSAATVANSSFRHVDYGVEWHPMTVTGPDPVSLTVRGTAFDGFSAAVSASYGRVVVDSNVFENGTIALDIGTANRVLVTRNNLTKVVEGLQVTLYDRSDTATVADNVLLDAGGSRAIWADGAASDTAEQVIEVLRNSVTCSAAGALSSAGVEVADAHLTVAGNHVSNCMAGVLTVINTGPARRDSIVGNVVDVPAGAVTGIAAAGTVEAVMDGNTITGSTTGQQTYGVIEMLGTCGTYDPMQCGPAPSASITGNAVNGGTTLGIHAEGVDSLVIAGNTVRNINAASGGYGAYGEDRGGISVMGYLARFARIVGNVVRGIGGNGIVVNHFDTTTVQVDSNVVADVDSSGVYLGYYFSGAGVAITRNLLTGARRDGIRVAAYGPVAVTGNNIEGNLPWGLKVTADRSSIDALNNWWGDANGPRCFSGCDLSVDGDTVDQGGANFSPFLTAPNDAAPPLPAAAPAFRSLAAAPQATSSALRAAAGRPGAAALGPLGGRTAAERRAVHAAEREQRLRELRAAIQERLRQQAAAPPGAAARREVRP